MEACVMQPSETSKSDPSRPSPASGEETREPERMRALERAIAERDNELAWTNERLIAELHERTAAQASALAAERFDPATGLPNRRLFEEQLARAALEHQGSSEPAAVLLVGGEKPVALCGSRGLWGR